MSDRWHFNEARPGDRARESQVEKFFNSDAVANRANAIVREGIQNSLDAAPDEVVVRVRITAGAWTREQAAQRLDKYTKGFSEHFNADGVRSSIAAAPAPTDTFRYLTFEDFGTSGLIGDPGQWWLDEHGDSNPFFNYFRAEGISDKVEGKRGRHGVGRLVFMFASRVHAIYGLTCRGGGEQLLMGTAVLRNHRVDHRPYLPDGWFGVADADVKGLTLPVTDPAFLADFKVDFGLTRQANQNGLSVVVPWLSDEVTAPDLVRSVVSASGYFHPILREKLVVEVVDEAGASTMIDAHTIKAVIESLGADFANAMQPVISLAEASLAAKEFVTLAPPGGNAPKWSPACVPDDIRPRLHAALDAGGLVALRVPMHTRPKGHGPVACHFDIFLQRDPSLSEGQIIFIREGIIISDLRPRRTSGVRALVVVDEGPLATFLGDAENPSHTQWQKEFVRDKYSFHTATLDYVIQSVPSVLALLSEDQKKPDTSLLIDLFSIPGDDEGPMTKEKRQKRKPGGEPEPVPQLPPAKPKPFVISQLKDGFQVRRGDPAALRPQMLMIRAAYGVRRGSPFARYNPADFRLGLGGIDCSLQGCEFVEFDQNWMLVEITDDDFHIEVTGFDTNRDLHIDVKTTEKELTDAAAS